MASNWGSWAMGRQSSSNRGVSCGTEQCRASPHGSQPRRQLSVAPGAQREVSQSRRQLSVATGAQRE
eukprot:9435840-Alexandrium_andersonii.AAC.1